MWIRSLPQDQSFFGLSSEFKEHLWEEIYICIKYLGATYNDILQMPTSERRFYIHKMVKEKERQDEQIKNMNNKNNKPH